MKQYVRGKVVDLNAVMNGRKNAEELQNTVATQERLADHHPAHAVYVYAQNQTSVMAEQLSALKEMDRFTNLISKAEEVFTRPGFHFWLDLQVALIQAFEGQGGDFFSCAAAVRHELL